MKKIAFALLVGGFLYGAYVAALDETAVDWTLFAIASIAAVAGVLLAKKADAAAARSGEVLATNRNELNESLGNLCHRLNEMTSREPDTGETLRAWIDSNLRNDLRRFAEARESMVHLYGLQAYADIMSEFAAGERYVNRVWSAAADDYDQEANNYLERASEQFRHAQSRLEEAAARST